MNYPPLKLAALASGRGSNLEAILNNIKNGRLNCEMCIVISNSAKAGCLEVARQNDIPAMRLSVKQFSTQEEFDDRFLELMKAYDVEMIVLAGYLKKLSSRIIREFRHKIINIHPALLPSFGGKGMYGHHVHEAVLEQGCKVSGVTVHLVDELFDHGPIVKQRCVPVLENDSADSLAARVLVQEHQIFAEALQIFAENRVEIKNHRAIILPGKERD